MISGKYLTLLLSRSTNRRFTDKLAARSASVTAVDFMLPYVERNKERNGHLKNVSFLQADVMQLEFPERKYDSLPLSLFTVK